MSSLALADFYLAATKTITYFKVLPIVANLGFKATNASVLGIAGNATNWQGRLFGAVGFVVSGRAKSYSVQSFHKSLAT